MLANELKELLELRRQATNDKERSIIDRAIDKLINDIPAPTKPCYPTIPPVPPIYIGGDDPSKWDVPFLQRWKPMCTYDPRKAPTVIDELDKGPTDTGALTFTNDLVNRQYRVTEHTKAAAEADAKNISILLSW